MGPSCHQGSVGPSVSISRPGEHLSQGDNLTPEGTFEALNSTFVPREEYVIFGCLVSSLFRQGLNRSYNLLNSFLKEVETLASSQLVLGDLIRG